MMGIKSRTPYPLTSDGYIFGCKFTFSTRANMLTTRVKSPSPCVDSSFTAIVPKMERGLGFTRVGF